nr:hypothetical protein [Tanacetum cinerariifolium]
MFNLFRGGKVTSGLSALQSEDSNCKGGDAAGSGMGRIRGDAGSGGDGIFGNGDDNGVSGDGGGLVIAKNLLASSLVKDSYHLQRAPPLPHHYSQRDNQLDPPLDPHHHGQQDNQLDPHPDQTRE